MTIIQKRMYKVQFIGKRININMCDIQTKYIPNIRTQQTISNTTSSTI